MSSLTQQEHPLVTKKKMNIFLRCINKYNNSMNETSTNEINNNGLPFRGSKQYFLNKLYVDKTS